MTEHPITETYIKRRIWENQNEKCAYCGERRQLKRITIDHVIPLSKGGKHEESNMICVCRKCNKFKDDMMPDEFVRHIYTILQNSIKISVSCGTKR